MISLFEGIMLSLLVLGTLGITSYLNRIMKKRGFKVNRALNLSLMGVRGFPAHLKAPLTAGVVSVRYPLLYRFPFKLGSENSIPLSKVNEPYFFRKRFISRK